MVRRIPQRRATRIWTEHVRTGHGARAITSGRSTSVCAGRASRWTRPRSLFRWPPSPTEAAGVADARSPPWTVGAGRVIVSRLACCVVARGQIRAQECRHQPLQTNSSVARMLAKVSFAPDDEKAMIGGSAETIMQ